MPMVSHEQSKLIEKIQNFLISNYAAPANVQLEDEVINLLEHPLLKQFMFANSQVTVIDHSIGGYRYMSDSIVDVTGYPKHEFLEKGLAFSFGLIHPQDLAILVPVFENLTALVQQVEKQNRNYVRFNYTCRYKAPNGYRFLYQQTIPLAFNESGMPYLVIALVSDITNYAKHDGVHYNITLNVPGEPIVTLLTSRHTVANNLLTDREGEIVKHLANGLDTNEIAERLFISKDTVRKHRQNILEKTEAKNSVHLVRMAVANGWI